MNKILEKNSFGYMSVVFCAVFSLMILGPFSVLINNIDGFTVGLINLLKYLSVIASVVFVVLFAITAFLPEKLSNIFVRGIALIVLATWVFSSFLYGDYGRLDGKELNIVAWSSLGILQAIVLVVILLFIVKAKINIIRYVIYFVFIVGLVSNAIGIMNYEEHAPKSDKTGFHSGMTVMSPVKNVLHVVLDTLQTDLFMTVINNDQSLKNKFEGFVFFEDALSVYRSTAMSIPMLITGEIYRNEQSKDEFYRKIKKRQSGVNKLEKIGYKLDAHTICKGEILSCTPISPQVVNEKGTLSETMLLLDIYIFKSVPDWLKSSVYNKGDWLLLKNSIVDSYLRIPSVGVGHLLFSKFVNELVVGHDVTPRYKFFHSFVTHDPLRLDEDCDIVPQNKITDLSRVKFVTCGIRHFAKLLDKLKSLGVYDNTMIILSADHGAGSTNDALNADAFAERGISRKIVGYASAALLVKPFNSRGNMAISEAQVSLRDIPRTILAANGIAEEDEAHEVFPAVDMLSFDEGAVRSRQYLHYEWAHKYWKEPKLPPITVYNINGDVKSSLSWPDSLGAIGVLNCNHPLMFNKPLANIKVPYGLAGIGAWGRWSNSKKVLMLFNLNTGNCSQNELSLKLRGFVTSKNKSQRADVLLNNTRIGNIVINIGEKNPREFVFSLSPELLLQDQINSLVFNIENPVSPRSVSESKDARLLGLGFESMVFQ